MLMGLSILLANLTSTLRGSTSSMSFEASANGTYAVVVKLQNRPYEIRIIVSKDFKGNLCIFNYEGIKKLTEITKTPTLEQALEGSSLIDFTPNRRGAYMFIIESNISENISGSIGLVEKKAISQDVQVDSTIIILFGLAVTLAATMSKSIKSSRTTC
jgi:predicted ATP-grasp superfamily ATP-dependent carboligase